MAFFRCGGSSDGYVLDLLGSNSSIGKTGTVVLDKNPSDYKFIVITTNPVSYGTENTFIIRTQNFNNPLYFICDASFFVRLSNVGSIYGTGTSGSITQNSVKFTYNANNNTLSVDKSSASTANNRAFYIYGLK